jgi:hypothetical protein
MTRTKGLTLAVLVYLGCAQVASGQQQQKCQFPHFTELQHGTALSIGPNLLSIANAYPQLWTVLGAARDAWLGTNAGGRIGDPSHDPGRYPSASDCPVLNGQGLLIQVGAMDFPAAVAAGSCPAIGSGQAAAVTDYEPFCSGCGTKSIIINTNVMWSFNPGPNEWDVQSAMAHEFGHMLGFTHQAYNECRENIYLGCADPNVKNTMNFYFTGETCERDLSHWDIDNANLVYPNP